MIGRKSILFGAISAAVGIGIGSYLAGDGGMKVSVVSQAEAAGGTIKSL